MVDLTVPYLVPLFLGMTFDARNTKPGVDIYDMKYVDDPQITENPSTLATYKVVTSMSDVTDALNLDGDISIKIKTGMVNIEGKGSYLKSTGDYTKRVEILTTLQYVSRTKSFKVEAVPKDGWENMYSPQVLGTHYVSSITYGAEMIASLRFEVFNSSDTDDVKAAVNGVFGSGGTGNEIAVNGSLEKLQKQVADKANLAISYYGTVPLRSIPNDIEGFRTLVNSFKEQVDESDMSEGIPMTAELTSLAEIAKSEDKDKFQFLKDKNLMFKISDLEMLLDEMRKARLDLTAWAKALPYHLDDKYEKEVGFLMKNITKVTQVFYEVIWKMDLTKGPEQLKPAFDAYDYDGYQEYGRYGRLVRKLILKLDPLIKRDEVTSDTYVQWGNNNCTALNAKILYEGFAISSSEEGIGGVAHYSCAPKSPGKSYNLDDSTTKSHLSGIRYPKLYKDSNPFKGNYSKKISEKGLVCAKCYSPDSAAVVKFSATATCPMTWEVMYTGYLMSARSQGGHTTEYICVDEFPSAPYAMEAESSSRDTVALTVVRSSGSLPPETYPNGALIRCVLCAMKSNQISF